MKFIRDIPSADPGRREELKAEGWKRLKEPRDVNKAMLYSLPFIIINGLIYGGIIYYLYPPFPAFFQQDEFNISLSLNIFAILYYIIGTYLFLILHEMVHAILIPNIWTSDQTYWGMTAGYGFVYTTEEITKNRFLLVSIFPFLVLSIVFPFLLISLGWLNSFTIFLGLINAMGSCVDILNIVIVGYQVPKGSSLVNNGFETYYKPEKL